MRKIIIRLANIANDSGKITIGLTKLKKLWKTRAKTRAALVLKGSQLAGSHQLAAYQNPPRLLISIRPAGGLRPAGGFRHPGMIRLPEMIKCPGMT